MDPAEWVLTCLTTEKAYSYWGHSHVGTQYFGVKITGTHGQEIASLHIQSCPSAYLYERVLSSDPDAA